jgi:peptide/nickel transport system permease protein
MKRWLGELSSRLVTFVMTLCGVVLLAQILMWMAPGDPIDLLTNGDELRPQLEAEWRLDQPLPVRYVHYLVKAATGDLGQSLTYRPGTPVVEVVAKPALRSLSWLISALALTLVWGTGLALWTTGRSSSVGRIVQGVSIAPVFLLAHLLVNAINEATFWAMQNGFIARPQWFALPDEASLFRSLLAIAVLAVGSGALSEVHAEVENALFSIRKSGYFDAARARNEPTWRHVAVNLVGPLTTIATTRMAFFVGGLVILERVLLLNGVGSILWQAAILRDYELAMAISLLAAAAVATARLVGDTIRLAVDPRLREARR